MALDILIVDDEEDIRDLVAGVLEDEGFSTRTAANSDSAIDALDSRRPSLVLLDVWLQGSKLDGLELLEEIKRRDPTIPVLMISGHGNIDTVRRRNPQGSYRFHRKAIRGRSAAGRPRDRDRTVAAREPDAARALWSG
ncbi:response regulator [Sphingobium scionense]